MPLNRSHLCPVALLRCCVSFFIKLNSIQFNSERRHTLEHFISLEMLFASIVSVGKLLAFGFLCLSFSLGTLPCHATLLDDAEAAIEESVGLIEEQFGEFYEFPDSEIPSCTYYDACDEPPTSSFDQSTIPGWLESGTPYHDLCAGGVATSYPESPDCPDVSHTTCAINVSYSAATSKFVAGTNTTSDSVRRAICVQSNLDVLWETSFSDVLDVHNYTEYVYSSVGGDGAFNQFPGTSWGECPGTYDPRFRPWYAAAAMGPKNIILVIDVSGSMLTAGRLSLAKEAARTVLGTLTDYDYVGIVAFSGTTRVFSETLQQFSSNTQCLLNDFIDRLVANGPTNYGAALDAAFDMLSSSVASGDVAACNASAILFLSDGEISSGASGSDLYYSLENHLSQSNAQIFSYALGSSVDTEVLLQMSCRGDGAAFVVPDSGDLADVMASYYTLFAAEIDPDDVNPMWTRYREYNSGNFVASVCKGAFNRKLLEETGITSLFGVVCADLTEDHITAIDGSTNGLDAKLVASSMNCPLRSLDPDHLELVREMMPSSPLSCRGVDTSPILMPVSWIIGIAVGCVVFVIIVIGVAVCVAKRKRRYY